MLLVCVQLLQLLVEAGTVPEVSSKEAARSMWRYAALRYLIHYYPPRAPINTQSTGSWTPRPNPQHDLLHFAALYEAWSDAADAASDLHPSGMADGSGSDATQAADGGGSPARAWQWDWKWDGFVTDKLVMCIAYQLSPW